MVKKFILFLILTSLSATECMMRRMAQVGIQSASRMVSGIQVPQASQSRYQSILTSPKEHTKREEQHRARTKKWSCAFALSLAAGVFAYEKQKNEDPTEDFIVCLRQKLELALQQKCEQCGNFSMQEMCDLVKHATSDVHAIGAILTVMPDLITDYDLRILMKKKEIINDPLLGPLLVNRSKDLPAFYLQNLPDEHFSVSEKHLSELNLSTMRLNQDFLIKPNLSSLARNIITDQKALEQKGYYTFVHAQRLAYRTAEHWQTFLWQLKHQKSANNFLFAYVKNLEQYSTVEEEARRVYLRNNGGCYNDKGKYVDNYPLFLNAALFGNAKFNTGSCTVEFFLKNSNVSPTSISVKDAFIYTGFGFLYEKYATELNELELLNNTLSKHGTLFLVAVPRNLAKECVYPVDWYGALKPIIVETSHGYKQVRDIEEIYKQLKKDPGAIQNYISPVGPEEPTFALIMDSKYGLNPLSGIIVKDYIDADPQKLAEYNQKEQALMRKIELDFLQQHYPVKYKGALLHDALMPNIDKNLAMQLAALA